MFASSLNSSLLTPSAQILAALANQDWFELEKLPAYLSTIYQTLERLEGNSKNLSWAPKDPAVPIDQSITDSYIICLEDGKKLKMLKRHLRTRYNMTIAEYKQRWNLPADYPTVAKEYAMRRTNIAKSTGLGKNNSHRKRKTA